MSRFEIAALWGLSLLGALFMFLGVCLLLSPFAFCYVLWAWRYLSDGQLLLAWGLLLGLPLWGYSYWVIKRVLVKAQRLPSED